VGNNFWATNLAFCLWYELVSKSSWEKPKMKREFESSATNLTICSLNPFSTSISASSSQAKHMK
jgi:hypothetical protein